MGFADHYGEKGWRHTMVHWLLSAGLWIGIFELFLFDGFVQPHSCIPYVHMSFIMHLYSRSLFSVDNLDLRPKSQNISCSLKFSF
jgi:hypothetical protein